MSGRVSAILPVSPSAIVRLGIVGGCLAAILQLLVLQKDPTGLFPILVLFERLLCVGLIGMLATQLALRGLGLLSRRSPFEVRSVQLAVLLAGALAIRLLVPPVFLHTEFVGLRYVVLALDLTRVEVSAANYGQGMILQGLLAHAFGGNMSAFFLGNSLLAVATIGLAASLAGRWSGSRFAAPAATIILAGLHPILVRSGASEDMHVAMAFYCVLSLWANQRYLDRRELPDLALAVGAAVLAACTRQFLAPMPIFLVLMFGVRRGWQEIRRPAVMLSAGFLLVAMALRWFVLLQPAATGGAGVQGGAGGEWGGMIRTASFLVQQFFVEPHPLVSQLVTPLPWLGALLLALGAIVVRRRALLGVLLMWLWLLALSLLVPWGGIQVGYLFRIPLITVSVLLAGMGWGLAYGWITERRSGRRLWLAAFVALTLAVPAGLVTPTLRHDARREPFAEQILFLESTAHRLPKRIRLVRVTSRDLGERNVLVMFPQFLVQPHGVKIEEYSLAQWRRGEVPTNDGVPVLLFRGVECHMATVFELNPAWRHPDRIIARGDPAELRRFINYPHPGTATIRARRQQCFAGLGDLTPVPGLTRRITPSGFKSAHMYYVKQPFTIGFFRLPSSRSEPARKGAPRGPGR